MCDFDNHVSAPYFRKTFELDFEPENAEIMITGLGFYEVFVNGQNITKGPLAPYISNFHQVIYYDSYDLTGILKKGKNASPTARITKTTIIVFYFDFFFLLSFSGLTVSRLHSFCIKSRLYLSDNASLKNTNAR